MRERPILFSGPMVKAIFADLKTETRRVAKLTASGHVKEPRGNRRWHPDDPEAINACPYQIGDRLWIREKWRAGERQTEERWRWIEYAADRAIGRRSVPDEAWLKAKDLPFYGSWRPSIFMPRWASRLTLEVTGRRLERLQAITEEAAIAEGVDAVSIEDIPRNAVWSRRQDFAQLWDRINGKRAPWSENRPVWAISFRRLTEESP